MKIYLEKYHGYLYLRIFDNHTIGAYNLVWMTPDRKWLAPGCIKMKGLQLDSDGRIVIE